MCIKKIHNLSNIHKPNQTWQTRHMPLSLRVNQNPEKTKDKNHSYIEDISCVIISIWIQSRICLKECFNTHLCFCLLYIDVCSTRKSRGCTIRKFVTKPVLRYEVLKFVHKGIEHVSPSACSIMLPKVDEFQTISNAVVALFIFLQLLRPNYELWLFAHNCIGYTFLQPLRHEV